MEVYVKGLSLENYELRSNGFPRELWLDDNSCGYDVSKL